MANILVVEDDELIQRMYQQIFTFRGHNLAFAANGEEGLEQAEQAKPTIILLDIMMPKLNGLDMLHKIKSMPKLKHIPVIILTNLIGITDAKQAIAAGAEKYVIKSDYTPSEIADIVETYLAEHNKKTVKSAR